MKVLALSCILMSLASAWSINGHMFVSNIAQNLLEDKAPDALAKANAMLQPLYNSTIDTTHEGDHAFVECATFADDNKYHGEMWQSDFHFKKIPYIKDGVETDYKIPVATRNLTVGMDDITMWLSGKGGDSYKDGYMYTFLMKKFENDEDMAKSYAFRLLVHYAGDIVQPFHNEAAYSTEFPDGDKGANSFTLPYHYGVDELHALWDFVLYTQHKNIARPFTEETWESFQLEVNELMSTYSYAVKSKKVYETVDFDAQAQEAYDIAITLYDGVTEDEAVPQDYLDQNIPLAYEQLIKGGYRLYYLVNYIFGDSVNSDPFYQF